jgi:Fe-S cluster assembly protein SufD
VRQHRDSRFVSHNIQLGGRLARHDINAELAEPGAEVTLNGLFVVGGRQHMDTHTRIHHAAPHTNSLEGYRGVADGHGRGVFKGRVLVDRDAQKIDAQQSSANLLLSEHAEIDTKPELEIYADDVKCSHGATVGQLDKESLFYLRSRAIDAETARGLLVFAFADEVVERLDLAPIRERLEQRLVGRLPDSDMLKGFV